MEREVAYYQIECDVAVWMQIVECFRSHLSRLRVPYFTQEQRCEEAEFVQFCTEHGIKAIRKVLLEHRGQGPLESSFYYFSTRETCEYAQDFIRFACDGGGKGMCWNGAEQFQKVTVNPQIEKIVNSNDIALKNYPISPSIYVISRRMRDLLEPLHFSGITITPCLNAGQKYSDEELSFKTRSKRLEREAKFFQLSVTSQAPGKPSIGNLLAASRCPRCNAVSILDGEREMEFKSTNLSSDDFQWFSDVSTENSGTQRMVGQLAIISRRALNFIISHKIKGIKAYSTDPPVKFAAVQIQQM